MRRGERRWYSVLDIVEQVGVSAATVRRIAREAIKNNVRGYRKTTVGRSSLIEISKHQKEKLARLYPKSGAVNASA